MVVEPTPEKSWMYFEENDDGTCTITINVPEFDIHEETVVAEFDMKGMLQFSVEGMVPEVRDQVVESMTIIPKSPEM